jgi:hypothetical protein
MIDKCLNNIEIADLMNDGGDKHYGWNFTNLFYGRKTTDEFRHRPGTSGAELCLGWAEFTASFAQSAKRLGSAHQLEVYSRDVLGLMNFINASVVAGVNIPWLMAPIFRGKSGSLEPIRVGNLTP